MKIVDGIIAVIYVIAMAVLFFLRDCEERSSNGNSGTGCYRSCSSMYGYPE